MSGKQWLILVMGLAVILIISDIGVTTTSFTATETCANNTFYATSAEWMQITT